MINNTQETEASGLYVSDCSMFTETPGKPSVFNIAALSKKLGGTFNSIH